LEAITTASAQAPVTAYIRRWSSVWHFQGDYWL